MRCLGYYGENSFLLLSLLIVITQAEDMMAENCLEFEGAA